MRYERVENTAMNCRLLLVDDDEFILTLLEAGLAPLGYRVDKAGDGMAAWERLCSAPDAYDLMLLDKHMPRMDGLSLLRKMKTDVRLAQLPVVMLTSDNRPEDVAEGLAAGAYYYLVKPAAVQIVDAIIRNALEDARRNRELRDIVTSQEDGSSLLRRGEFEYRTLQQARSLALLLANASGNPKRTINGYAELLINAVEHGNLAIGYAEKSALLVVGGWAQEVERRLAMPEYAARRVTVVAEKDARRFSVTITDQGEGFDWNRYLDFQPERAFDLNGRGIAMSRNFSFDCIEYLGRGNSVVATILY